MCNRHKSNTAIRCLKHGYHNYMKFVYLCMHERERKNIGRCGCTCGHFCTSVWKSEDNFWCHFSGAFYKAWDFTPQAKLTGQRAYKDLPVTLWLICKCVPLCLASYLDLDIRIKFSSLWSKYFTDWTFLHFIYIYAHVFKSQIKTISVILGNTVLPWDGHSST